MTLKEKIIDLIERNRISSTEVGDALGKSGVINEINILNGGQFVVGEVQYVLGYDRSNWPIHEQIQDVKKNSIIYVDTFNCGTQAVFGDLVSKYLKLYCQVKGIVVNGLMRDNHTLIKERYPIWCKGVTPLGCYNKKMEYREDVRNYYEKNKAIFDRGIMVCDDSGCTLIQEREISQKLYEKLEYIEIQEDIWFYCIDTLKWTTFDTVCRKRYLEEPHILPLHLQEKLAVMDLEDVK